MIGKCKVIAEVSPSGSPTKQPHKNHFMLCFLDHDSEIGNADCDDRKGLKTSRSSKLVKER